MTIDHLTAEINAARSRGHRPVGLPPTDVLYELLADCSPNFRHGFLGLLSADPVLKPNAPVPACTCESCIGIPAQPPLLAGLRRSHGRSWDDKVALARSVSLGDVAHRLGVEIVKSGGSQSARCPLHDDHDPSMSIESDAGLWFCHVCSEGGDAIQLWMRARRVSFAEAVRELAA